MYRAKNRRHTKSPLKIGIVLIAIALLLGILTALQASGLVHFTFPGSSPHTIPVTAGQSTKGEKITTSSGSNVSSTNNTPAPGTIKQDTTKGATLIQPTGDFVSAHYNVPVNASLSSVCNTTAGAKCQIIFTSGTQTHSLAAQTTDLGGATYWQSWTPASIGLTSGDWQVKAIATLDGSTQTSVDALSLEIVQ